MLASKCELKERKRNKEKENIPPTPKETFFCLMEYYGKSDHQKALSFCCSDQAIRSTKSRLNKKLDIGQLR